MSKIAKVTHVLNITYIDATTVYSLRICNINAEGLIIATLRVYASIQTTVYISYMHIMYM